MSSDGLERRRNALEGIFCRARAVELQGELQDAEAHEEALRELARGCGVEDTGLVAPLIAVGVRAESLAALMLAPLVVIAWADERLSHLERLELLAHARDLGVDAATPAGRLLAAWLEDPPGPELLDAWIGYTRHLAASLDEVQRGVVEREVLRAARAVACADGGVLRIGRRIAPAERAVLDQLAQAFVVTGDPD